MLKYIIVGLVVCLALTVMQVIFLEKKITGLQKEAVKTGQREAKKDAAIRELQGNLKVKDEAIKRSNEEIDKLASEGKERERKAAEARKAAEIASRTNVILSQQLLSAKPKTDNFCKEASDLVGDYLEKRKANREKASN